jgi:hypothetical protein
MIMVGIDLEEIIIGEDQESKGLSKKNLRNPYRCWHNLETGGASFSQVVSSQEMIAKELELSPIHILLFADLKDIIGS